MSSSSAWYGYTPGQILRELRRCGLNHDTQTRTKWLGRLNDAERCNLNRLESLPSEFQDALDRVIPFAGLWHGLPLDEFPGSLDPRHWKEWTRYLVQVSTCWSWVLGHQRERPLPLGATTARMLQDRCPGRSDVDYEVITAAVADKSILRTIPDEKRKWEIIERLCLIEYSIPSLHGWIKYARGLEKTSNVFGQPYTHICSREEDHAMRQSDSETDSSVNTIPYAPEDQNLPRRSWNHEFDCSRTPVDVYAKNSSQHLSLSVEARSTHEEENTEAKKEDEAERKGEDDDDDDVDDEEDHPGEADDDEYVDEGDDGGESEESFSLDSGDDEFVP